MTNGIREILLVLQTVQQSPRQTVYFSGDNIQPPGNNLGCI